MVLYISTGFQVLGIVYLDQLKGAHYTHISYHDRTPKFQTLAISNSVFYF